MLKSKSLKERPEPSKLYYWWLDTEFSRHYYRFMHKFIKNPIYQVKRLAQWYWNVFRFDYDFDGHCLFAIIEYKLKRLQKVLLNAYSDQEPKDMKALALAIKLAAKLKDDEYESIQWDRHEKKWGKLKTWMTPIQGSTSRLYNSSRPKAITEEDKVQERADRMIGSCAAGAKMKRDERNLYAILHKHLRIWWD